MVQSKSNATCPGKLWIIPWNFRENINSNCYIFFGAQSLVKNYQMAQDLAKLIEASESEEITVKITISYRFTNNLGDATDCTFFIDRMQICSAEQ